VEDVSGTSRDAGNRGSCIRHAVFSLLNAVSTKASTMASRPFCVMSLRMVLSFLSAVCACRPSRNCVPSARPRACQGRQPRRGWSEAKSLYRVAASRRLAVVMAGFAPFVSLPSCRSGRVVPVVSFRSGDPWPATGAGARDPARPSRSQGCMCASDRLKKGAASAARDNPGRVWRRRRSGIRFLGTRWARQDFPPLRSGASRS
jgi:hypothetical protein